MRHPRPALRGAAGFGAALGCCGDGLLSLLGVEMRRFHNFFYLIYFKIRVMPVHGVSVCLCVWF